MSEDYPVGKVAALAGVTVRTLHHYDEVGLVRPSARSVRGYRVYSAADIERLQQVLLYRRLGFGLDEIRPLLDDPSIDPAEHLRRQRELLLKRADALAAMVAAIDRQLEARGMGMQLTPEEQLDVFGTGKVGGEWADEAEQRWADSEPYQESQRRAATYSQQDWIDMKAQSDDALRRFAALMSMGEPPDGEAARTLAEEHRLFLSTWFYECSLELHRNLALMYVEDERFRSTFDGVAPGMADYVSAAIVANADGVPADGWAG